MESIAQSPPLSRPRAHALLHFTVLLWGVTAILGKSITLPALPLVFYRVVIVTALMGAVLAQRKISFRVPRARFFELAGSGVLVALHWLTFYGSVKIAGVSIAVLCLSAVTFFTALLEPLFFRRRVRRHELVLGGFVVLGVVLILRFESTAKPIGYVMGIASAFFSAAFGTWNGKLAKVERGERMTFYELASAIVTCVITFAVSGGFVAPWDVSVHDWVLLGLMSVFCTLFPWLWSLRILQTLSPFTTSISVALEPLYSIAIAYFLWPTEERLSPRFYVGAALLIALVPANALFKHRSA